jgi:NhaA family Na+:H+ antiporter
MTWRARLAARILSNSLLLVLATFGAVLWANLDLESYERVAHPLEFWVNEVGMVFFFALAAKEVFEAALPGGPLASVRQALSPLAGALGGMMAPALIYVALVWLFGPPELLRGWAIPCATDIAFSAMVARLVFPRGHPAIAFLLLLAIADDALGLLVLAVFYPSGALFPLALATLVPIAIGLAFWLRRRGVTSFWWYIIGPGGVAWLALYLGGIHPALAMVPIVPFMPHAPRDLGLFVSAEVSGSDTLNRFEHWWATPVQIILLLFGFANAGVSFAQVGPGTFYVLTALFVGKPVGIVAASQAARLVGGRLPEGLDGRDVVVLGIAASIGFTVSLFFATAAFPAGASLSETKMAALLSLLAAPIVLVAARVLSERREAQ